MDDPSVDLARKDSYKAEDLVLFHGRWGAARCWRTDGTGSSWGIVPGTVWYVVGPTALGSAYELDDRCRPDNDGTGPWFEASVEGVNLEPEEWRPIDGYEGKYEVSNFGRVRSLLYSNQHVTRLRNPPKIMKLGKVNRGSVGGDYRKVTLRRPGEKREFLVHRLVLETFVGPCPEGMETAHLDNNPGNNLLGNLEWKTSMDNANDRRIHGTTNKGERNGGAKLTEEDIPVIRDLYKNHTAKEIATQYGVSDTCVREIALRRTWAHVP